MLVSKMLLSFSRNQEIHRTRVPPSYAGQHINMWKTDRWTDWQVCVRLLLQKLAMSRTKWHQDTDNLLYTGKITGKIKVRRTDRPKTVWPNQSIRSRGGGECRAKCPTQEFLQKTYLYPRFCRTADWRPCCWDCNRNLCIDLHTAGPTQFTTSMSKTA